MFDMHRTVLKQSAIGSAMFFEVPKLNKVTHSVQGLFLLRKNFIEEGNTMLFQTKCFLISCCTGKAYGSQKRSVRILGTHFSFPNLIYEGMLSTLNLGVRSGVFGNKILLSELLTFNISGNCVGVDLWELVVSWEVFARNKKAIQQL